MHINPSMSGPVQFLTREGVRPYCVAFAGAEFVVLEKTRIGDEEFWVVHVEVCMCKLPLQFVAWLVGGVFCFVCIMSHVCEVAFYNRLLF